MVQLLEIWHHEKGVCCTCDLNSGNLIKPVLAGELNHVKKEVNTEIGVIICATKDLKDKGGFDGAVGEYEKFLTYLDPLRDVLSVPM